MDKISWTPTLTFATSTPTLDTSVYEAWVSNGWLFYAGYLATTDGAGATALTITPPLVVPDINIEVPGVGWKLIDTSFGDPLPYVDLANNTAESRTVGFYNFGTATDDKVLQIGFSGFTPILKDYTSWTSTATYTTGTPTSITAVSKFKPFGNAILAVMSQISADNTGCTDVTLTLDQAPPDVDVKMAAAMLEDYNTSAAYRNTLAYVNALASTDAARLVACNYFATATDNQQIEISTALISMLANWKAYDINPVWQTEALTPASATEKGFYTIHDGMCFFTIYLSSDDGNAAVVPTFDLPVPCAWGACDIPCMSYELVNASTYSNPGAYISASAENPLERLISFKNWSAMTNAAACAIAVTGWFPVEV